MGGGPGDGSSAAAGRVALVTGANRGLGLAIVERLHRDGYRVVGTYRSDHPDVDGVTWVRLDATSTESVDAAFAEVEATVGPVEVVVANAGITADGLAVRMSDDDWSSVIDTNLTGAFRVARRAATKMLRIRWGRIVFVSSVSGAIGSPGQANYAAAKAGLVGLARSLARELASRNVCVNVVAPGPIDTDMTAELTEAQQEALRALVPLGRFGSAAEVAAAVAFLAADDAGYVTGAVIDVSGGVGMGS